MQEKYLLNGQAVCVLEKLRSGFLVSDIYDEDGNDGEPIESEPYFVEQVFDAAPTKKYDDKIANLNAKISELTEISADLEKQIAEVGAQEKMRLERYSRYKQLQYLDDYLDGKITHFVILDKWNTKIIELKEMLDDYRAIKLLSLFGNTKGDLLWRVNRYSDGSGSDTNVVPCLSYDEAVEKLSEYVQSRIQDGECSKDIIDLAWKYRFELPTGYVDRWREENVKHLRERIAERQKDIKKFEDEIAAFNF